MKYSTVLDHPYWRAFEMVPGGNPFINLLATANREVRQEFLELVHEGFYPISASSPGAFARVYELSDHPETRKIAKKIHDVEMGLMPLLDESPQLGLSHKISFKKFMESLELDFDLKPPSSVEAQVLADLNYNSVSLAGALAACEVIEGIAPTTTFAFRDLMAQWSVATGRTSREIESEYLDEHCLTEGSSSPDQHICLVNQMLAPYFGIEKTKDYLDYKLHYQRTVREHLDRTFKKLQNLESRLKSLPVQSAVRYRSNTLFKSS